MWLQAIYLMCARKKGISTRQLQRMLGCGLKTAWFLGHRIREAMKETREFFDAPLGRRMARPSKPMKPTSAARPSNRVHRGSAPKQAVLALWSAAGPVRSFHVPNVTAHNLRPIIGQACHTRQPLHDREGAVYTEHRAGISGRHQTVNHSAKEYVRGDVYTNTVEGYFSILKRGIYGMYQHVSEAHLAALSDRVRFPLLEPDQAGH